MRKKLQAKGVLSVVLCQTLLAMTLAGCGETGTTKNTEKPKESQTTVDSKTESKEQLEPVKLVVYLNQATGTGDKQVQDAVNNLEALKAINTQIEFVTYPQGDKYDEKVTLALSSGEPLDIVSGDTGDSYITRAKAGAYADISEALNTKYTKLRDTLLEEHWKAATVDGKIYGVKTFKESATDWGFFMASSYVKDKGIDLTKKRELKDIKDILQMLKEDGRATFMLTYGSIGFLNNITFANDYISLVDSMAAVSFKDPTKVVNYFESDEFRNLCFTAKEWYQEGLIAPDILTKENYSAEEKDEKLFGLRITNHAPLAETTFSAGNGFDCSFLQLTPTTSALGNVGWIACVNAKSKNIDRAVHFLEVWNTQPEVVNTITYGVEGVHYDLVDGQVDWSKYPNHSDIWKADGSRLGNQMISYSTTGSPKNIWDVYLETGKAARKVPTVGFFMDTSKINNEKLALAAVRKEYLPMLCSGTVEDVEATLKEFIDKLKSNGVQAVIDEAQKQLDSFYANNK